MEGGAHGDGVFGIDEAGAGFGLLDGRHNRIDDFAVYQYWGVQWWRRISRMDGEFGFVGKVKVASIARACFGFVEIRGVGVKPEVHGRSLVLDASVRMAGSIVKEMVDAVEDVGPRAGGDRGGDGADGRLHGVVDGACIVIEYAGEFLTEFDLSGSELA